MVLPCCHGVATCKQRTCNDVLYLAVCSLYRRMLQLESGMVITE